MASSSKRNTKRGYAKKVNVALIWVEVDLPPMIPTERIKKVIMPTQCVDDARGSHILQCEMGASLHRANWHVLSFFGRRSLLIRVCLSMFLKTFSSFRLLMERGLQRVVLYKPLGTFALHPGHFDLNKELEVILVLGEGSLVNSGG